MSARPAPRRRRVAAAVLTLLVVLLAPPAGARPDPGGDPSAHHDDLAPSAGPTDTRFAWPVPGGLVAPFDPPSAPWAAGHRGVDLSVRAGQPVHAMAAGVVGFAGTVAGRAWASVDHPGGVRTTVGPLAVVAVEAGRAVRRGGVLGVAAATAHADAGSPRTGLLHVSARVAGTYVDPDTLVGAWVPSLVPD